LFPVQVYMAIVFLFFVVFSFFYFLFVFLWLLENSVNLNEKKVFFFLSCFCCRFETIFLDFRSQLQLQDMHMPEHINLSLFDKWNFFVSLSRKKAQPSFGQNLLLNNSSQVVCGRLLTTSAIHNSVFLLLLLHPLTNRQTY